MAGKTRYCDGVLKFSAAVQGKRLPNTRAPFRIPPRGLIGFSIDGYSKKGRLAGGPNSARRKARRRASQCLRALSNPGDTVPQPCKNAQVRAPFSPITASRARAIAKTELCKTAYAAGFYQDIVLKVVLTGATTDKRRNRHCRSDLGVLSRFKITCPPPTCPPNTQRQSNGQCYQFVDPVCPAGSRKHTNGRCFKVVRPH